MQTTVAKITISTANGQTSTITIKNPRNNLTLQWVQTAMAGFLTGAAQLKHRSSSGDGYTTVDSAKYVTEADVPDEEEDPEG